MAGEPTLTLVGNITANPEQRGDTVTFTIAHNTRRRDRNGQTVDGDAVFMRCAAFGDLAQNIMRSCYKGMRVVATGYMKTNSWTDKNTGQQRSNLEMIVTDLGPSLRFGVTQFQKTSGQQSNGNGYRQNNYGGGYQQPNNGYQQGAYNNYQQQGYGQQAPAQTPAQPAAPSQPAMDPWATTTPASTGSERRRRRPGILNGSDIDRAGRFGRQPPPIQGGLSPTHRLLTGQQRGCGRHDPPYEIGFMNRAFDSTGVAFDVALWLISWRVLSREGMWPRSPRAAPIIGSLRD